MFQKKKTNDSLVTKVVVVDIHNLKSIATYLFQGMIIILTTNLFVNIIFFVIVQNNY
jgi:hypothetical protein